MKVITKDEYLQIASEHSYLIEKTTFFLWDQPDPTIYLLADIEAQENEGFDWPFRVELFGYDWILPNEMPLEEGSMKLRGEMCGGITFIEDDEEYANAFEAMVKGYDPVYILAENDAETKDILSVIGAGEYVIVIKD